jgi:hypothetical protein
MKKIVILFILFPFACSTVAQENIDTPWDIYSVVDTDSITTVVLWQNAKSFLQEKEGCTLVSEDSTNSVKATCGFWAYKSKLLKSIDGRIFFNVLIETKENRYRYFINDFHFMPYSRNRYSRYEANKNETKPLHELNSKQSKTWKGYQEEAKLFGAELAKELEKSMIFQQSTTKPDEKVQEKEW